MTLVANLIYLYVGKYTRNSYVSGVLTDEHNMSAQSSSNPGIMVSMICSYFVLALLFYFSGAKLHSFFDITKKIMTKYCSASLAGTILLEKYLGSS